MIINIKIIIILIFYYYFNCKYIQTSCKMLLKKVNFCIRELFLGFIFNLMEYESKT